MQVDHEAEVFVWRYQGKLIIPVVGAGRTFLITFLPQDHFSGGSFRKRRQGKEVAATSRKVDGREYRRARDARTAFREQDEA